MSRQRFDDAVFDGMTLRDYVKVRQETGTFSSNAVTINSWFAVLTTESLTTANGATTTLTITKSGVVAGDLIFLSWMGGSNTGGVPYFSAVGTTNTVTITARNLAIVANAFNGTFVLAIAILKKM